MFNLLNLNCFINNEYLTLYYELISNNIGKEALKFKTQEHHFIPISYYTLKYNIIKGENGNNDESKKKADSDPNNFKVNLLYKDHILAHYYLCLCTEGQINYLLKEAFFKMSSIKYISKDIDIKKLDKYQEIYESYMKLKSEDKKLKKWASNHFSSFYSNMDEIGRKEFGYKINEGRKKLGWEPLEDIIKRVSKEKLNHYYIETNHSKEETAKHFNTNCSKIDDLMNYYSLHKFRTKHMCLEIINNLNRDIDKIKRLYIIEDCTQRYLANLYNCNVNTIQEFLHNNKIYKVKSYTK